MNTYFGRVRNRMVRFFATLAITASCGGVPAGNSMSTWRNPLPTGNSLNGIAYGHGLYVIVGDAGTLLKSRNGVDWQSSQFGTQYVIESGETFGTTVPWNIRRQLPFTAPGEAWADPDPIEPGASRFYRVRNR